MTAKITKKECMKKIKLKKPKVYPFLNKYKFLSSTKQ